MSIDAILDQIVRREGGYVDHSADRGGCTKYGITRATLKRWRGGHVTCSDVAAIDEREARAIYADHYVIPNTWIQESSDRLFVLMVDMAVNHGMTGANKMLQRALGVADDGIIGPATKHAFDLQAGLNDHGLYYRTIAERIRFYGRLITNDRRQARFAAGWMNRVAEFL